MICFVDNVLWGGDTKFTETVNQLRQTFHIGAEHTQIFVYIGGSQRDIKYFYVINIKTQSPLSGIPQ